jgi:hypothetical protein
MKKKHVRPVIDKSTTDIVVVLDRSGSMKKIAESTVSGFNEFINEHKNAEGDATITLAQFDDRYEMLYNCIPVKEVNDLVLGETFIPRGTTALLDAIGRTINSVNSTNDVIFVIITDGQENASVEYSKDDISKLIKEKEDKNEWKFIFLAANQDAIQTGNSIGIKSNMAMTYAATAAGAGSAFKSMSKNTRSYRSSKFSSTLETVSVTELNFTDEQRNEQNL